MLGSKFFECVTTSAEAFWSAFLISSCGLTWQCYAQVSVFMFSPLWNPCNHTKPTERASVTHTPQFTNTWMDFLTQKLVETLIFGTRHKTVLRCPSAATQFVSVITAGCCPKCGGVRRQYLTPSALLFLSHCMWWVGTHTIGAGSNLWHSSKKTRTGTGHNVFRRNT